jgi:phosphatidylglycerophosphate synthase
VHDLPEVRTDTPDTLSSAYDQRLRKLEPPFVLPITHGNRLDLERRLFSWSYKGITDLVTKWVWPRPARWVTAVCARYGIRPNHVTIASLVLVVIAGALFAFGQYGWGLLAAWLMTFLDTVDGKLARVTLDSSRFGYYFDHAIDVIHPPLWYIAWGMGLWSSPLGVSWLSVSTALWVIIVGYVVGRLVEGSFKLWLGRFGLFSWRPTDSYFRLITARRNPNLILLTIGAAMGRPDLGLFAVAFWTALTSLFLIVRLAMAVHARIVSGPLQSWLLNIGQVLDNRSLAVRLFTRQATPQSVRKQG